MWTATTGYFPRILPLYFPSLSQGHRKPYKFRSAIFHSLSFVLGFKLLKGLDTVLLCLVSGIRRDVDNICALLGYYAASCGNCLPTFQNNVSVPSSRVNSPTLEDSTDKLSRNVGKQLPYDAA
jgi:hypothetical protein